MVQLRPVRAMAMPRRAPRLVVLTGALVFIVVALRLLLWAPTPQFVPSSFDWSTAHEFHPPGSIKNLPTGQPRSMLPVQAPIGAFKNPHKPDPRRDVVRKVFRRSFHAYKKHAWMKDELAPVTGGSKETFGGWAATLVDSLDTLWIMDLKADFWEASSACAAIDFGKTSARAVNLFETTIRHLGGLLSAYDLSGDMALLQKAVELGDMLYMGFDTPNRLPGFWLNFDQALSGYQTAGTDDASAVPTSLSLEFTRLSQITGNPKYYDATDRVTRFLEKVQYKTRLPGMWPTTLDFRNQEARSSSFTLGAWADSLYEYIPKMHALLGGADDTYERLYRGAMKPAIKHLLFRPMLPDNNNILFSGDAFVHVRAGTGVELLPESQHLTCFAGGMFGLGGKLFGIEEHVDIGERLARGCGWAYGQFPAGVMPEVFKLIPCDSLGGCKWDEKLWEKKGDTYLEKGWADVQDPRYILRPEAIESIFLLYRMTGKEDLRDLAWEMFEGILQSTKTDMAHSAINDVTRRRPKKDDSMESFWTAETLKYFYLIFSPPDLISLDEYVFNTEAHPFKRPR